MRSRNAATGARNLALRVCVVSICALLASFSLFALDAPPPPDRWFTDRAGLVTPTEADLLNRKLSDFEQQSGAQFITYTFPSLENESIEEFTIRCAEKWKVGQKKYDNGLILFVFAKERKVRIEVGYGLEGTMTDAFSSRVIREFLAPEFQRGQYAKGLNAAADAVIKKIRTGEEPVAPLQRRGSENREPSGVVTVLFVLFVVFILILPWLRRGGGGFSGCLLPLLFSGGGTTFGGGGFSSGGGGGFGGGGFSGGGGGFGGGGSTGGW